MLNICGIVMAILKMATGRIFAMLGINSGHHYLPTYLILMISGNVEFLPPIFSVFWQTSRKFWKRRIAPLMVTYHYVKFYVSIIIQLEVININVRNFKLSIGFYSNPHLLWTPKNMALTPFTTNLKSITPPRFMKFCPVVPEISRGQIHASRKERIRIIIIKIKIKIIIRNGAKTISLQTLFGRLNNEIWL